MRSFLHRAGVTISFFFFLAVPLFVSAATLGVSPSSGAYTVGKTFPVTINVSSASQSINAISGTLRFPTDELQVVSVSKTGSVLSLWVQDPSFSNSVGSVDFEGVVPNPGFQGSNGRVITVNFKVIGPGSAAVKLSNGSVLANDGSGTNILDILNNASFALSAAKVSAPPPVSIPVESAPAGTPSFVIKALPSNSPTDSQPMFSFVVTNPSAPIDHYTIQIDSGTPGTWQDDGSGVYQTSPLEPGAHTMSVQAYDTLGNFIPASLNFSIAPVAPTPTSSTSKTSWFQSLSSSLTIYLALIIPIVALLFALFYLIFHGVHRVRISRSKFQRELRDVEHLVDKAFVLLKEDVEDSIRLLERTRSRRKLTQEEDRLIERLRQNLIDAEAVIHSEVRKVERGLE